MTFQIKIEGRFQSESEAIDFFEDQLKLMMSDPFFVSDNITIDYLEREKDD